MPGFCIQVHCRETKTQTSVVPMFSTYSQFKLPCDISVVSCVVYNFVITYYYYHWYKYCFIKCFCMQICR